MEPIDEVGLMVAAIGQCCLCSNESGDIYSVDFILADNTHVNLIWHICLPCRAEIQDLFSDWAPIFCVACKNAGWTSRSKLDDMPSNCYSVFINGCYKCSGVCEAGWYL